MDTMKEYTLYDAKGTDCPSDAFYYAINKAKELNTEVFLNFKGIIIQITQNDIYETAFQKFYIEREKDDLYNQFKNGTVFSTERLARKLAALINNE